MKTLFFTSLAVVLLAGCFSTQQMLLSNNSKQFENKYTEFLEPGERQVDTWYHYVTSFDQNGDYIIRTFFPETKQITSLITYTGPNTMKKNGPAIYWFDNGFKKSDGEFENNEKQGLWRNYSWTTGQMVSEGNYHVNNMTGEWSYYLDGKLSSKYTYDEGILEGAFVTYDSLSNVTNKGLYKADTIFQQTNPPVQMKNVDGSPFKIVEEMPRLASCNDIADEEKKEACSTETLLKYIYQNIKYPAIAREYGVEGMVVATFIVEKDGTISEIGIPNGLCQGMKNECMRVVEGMPEWSPGKQDGKAVRVQFNLPIKFRLE